MSPCPHAPGSDSRLTKNRPFLPTGVGQKSSEVDLTGSPRLTAAPQGAEVLARVETHMSSPPFPPGRFEARYMLRPSGDWIGQPSCAAVLISAWLPPNVSIFCAFDQASAEPVNTRTTTMPR